MTVERIQVRDNVVLRVAGRIDAENAPVFKQRCESCISEGSTNLVIDLGDLAYVSSMGLRCFVEVGKMLRDKGGELRICRLNGLVKQVFEITTLNRVFPLYESVESALSEG